MSRPYGQSALDSEVKKGRDNRTNVQKRTFTKWVNSHLVKKGHRIEDLFLDLRDGIYLLELLELISRDSIPKPERGKLASSNIGKTANVGKALTYLKTKVTLENIGPNDIVEGNPVLTMGLLWTVILRFEIQDISVDELSAKDALLLWVKKKTKGYPGVNVNDFSKSFRDGLAFNALIHAHRPELINYDGLKEDQWHANLANAFNVAENRLGIFSLLDPADVAVEKPDERSVMTYVAALYHYFTSQESDDVAGQRIANILKELAEIEKLQEDYEMKVNDLLRWIQAKINALDSREFPNVIKDVQALQTDLKTYIATEKAPKLKEKSDQEGQFFNIQSRLRAMNRPKYKPKEGLALHDINKAWSVLEAAEHDREAALVQEIARLRKLEELAKRFNKKADILNQWLEETERLIEQDKASETGSEAALKKLEAIMADVSAHEDRIGKTLLAGNQLQSGNYHGKESTTAKAKALEDRWKALNHSILLKKESLMSAFKLQRFYDDTRKVLEVIVTTKNSAGSQDYGSDPEHVEDLLQKHAFLESDAANIRERISNLEKERTRLSEDGTAKDLDAKIREINEALGDLDKVMGERKAKLLDAKNTHAALLALEDEDLWIKEREHDATSTSMGKDPISAQKMLKEHEALVSALETHEPVVSSVLESSKKLSAGNPQGGEELKQKIASVEEGWKNLKDASKDRHNKLKDSLDAHQYFSQADENEQFIREKEPLLATTDLGKDEESVAALLKKHQQLQDELQAHDFNIKALRSNAKGLLDKKNTESPRIEERQKEIDAMWNALRQNANQRAKDLKDAEKLYFFNKGADALNRWLDEKESFIKEADLADNLDNLGAMQKRLDELERDLAQNQSKHKELDAIARKLAEEGHPDAAKAREAADLLGSRLSVLEDQIRGRKGEVESAEQATDLLSALGDLNELLKQKEKAAASDDYGKDLASVAALKKKQDALNRDLDSLAQKVASFEPQIEKLKSESSPVAPVVEGKHRELEETLDRVRGLAQERDKKLDESLQLLRFDKDATETLAWLAEKQKEVEQLEEPKDARSAEALLKKHEKLEKAAEVYQGPRTVEQEGLKIIEEQHPSAEEVRQKLNEVREAKARLEESLAAKGKELKDAYELERFKGEANRAKIWLANKHHEASSEEVPKDQAEAEAMLQALGDIKAEAEAFSETMHRVAESGNRLVEGGHPEKEAVVQTLQGLATERAALTRAIEDRQKRLEEAASLMGFEREAQEVEDWLDAADAVLASHEAPQTMEAIEAQREAYQALQADAKIEAGKVKGVDQTASRLIEEDHEAKEAIDRRRGDIMQRWNALGAELAQRQSNLEHEAKLLQYLRDAEELEAWMRGKEEELSSEPQSGGKDLARRQEAFELDIAARGKKLEDLRRDLSDLEAQEGFDASKAALKQKELDAMFASLTEGSDRTAKQLKDASSLRQADRDLDDVELWLKGVESALASEDPGADLAASQALLKKHHLLEAEIASQDGPIRTAVQGAQHLIDEGHPASEELRDRREAVLARYAAVKDRAKARREQLEGSQSLQKYLRGVDEEKEYVRYKTAVVSSPELGRDSNSTQKLQAKHGALLQELENHEEATYRPLVAAGRELVGSGAVAADHVEPVLAALEDDWKNLRELAATRSRALADHAEHLAFRASQEDELRWLEQQINALEHAEPAGDSLSYCKALLKKNDDFMTELEAHRARIHNCHTEGDRLVQAGSTHGEEIKATQQEIEAKMQTLEDLARARKAYLEGSLRSQQLAKDASDIEAFVKENQAILDAAGAPSDLAAAQRQLEQLERLESRADGMAGMVRSLGTSRSELEAAPGRQAQDAAVLERCGAVQQGWETFSSALAKRKGDVEERARAFRAADEKCLAFAERAATLNSWLDNAAEDLSEPVTVYSVEAAKKLQEDDAQFHASLDKPKRDFGELQALDGEVKGLGTEKNPYTPFTMELLSDKWEQDQAAAVDRTQLVGGEVERQARNDQLRRRFAELANALAQWLEATRGNLLEGSGEALEDQLLAVQKRMEEIKAKQAELKPLEQLSSQLEEAMVFDNKYTEHNTIGLSQKLDALKQLATSIEHNIQQKIEAKNYTGVSEETKKEWSETFDYFDKDHKGLLDRVQFKSCLRGCGFDLPVVPEGKKDEEFEQIMKFVDSEGNGTVSKQEFIDFMFSQKKTTASSASEVIASFLTIAHDRPTVTEEELRASLPANQVEYCLKHMKTVEGGYDYKEFVNRFFSPEGIRTTHAKEELPSELKAVDTWASGRNQKMESHQSKRSDQQAKAQEKIEREKLKIAEAKAKREAARAALAKA